MTIPELVDAIMGSLHVSPGTCQWQDKHGRTIISLAHPQERAAVRDIAAATPLTIEQEGRYLLQLRGEEESRLTITCPVVDGHDLAAAFAQVLLQWDRTARSGTCPWEPTPCHGPLSVLFEQSNPTGCEPAGSSLNAVKEFRRQSLEELEQGAYARPVPSRGAAHDLLTTLIADELPALLLAEPLPGNQIGAAAIIALGKAYLVETSLMESALERRQRRPAPRVTPRMAAQPGEPHGPDH